MGKREFWKKALRNLKKKEGGKDQGKPTKTGIRRMKPKNRKKRRGGMGLCRQRQSKWKTCEKKEKRKKTAQRRNYLLEGPLQGG